MKKIICTLLLSIILTSSVTYAGEQVIRSVDIGDKVQVQQEMSAKEKEKYIKEVEAKKRATERKEKVEATKQRLRETFNKQ